MANLVMQADKLLFLIEYLEEGMRPAREGELARITDSYTKKNKEIAEIDARRAFYADNPEAKRTAIDAIKHFYDVNKRWYEKPADDDRAKAILSSRIAADWLEARIKHEKKWEGVFAQRDSIKQTFDYLKAVLRIAMLSDEKAEIRLSECETRQITTAQEIVDGDK